MLGVDPARDRSEVARLGLPSLDLPYLEGPLRAAYAASGFAIERGRVLSPDALAAWPSTWARRLAFGQPRSTFQVEARAVR